MSFEEACVHGLRWPDGFNRATNSDCLDWLGAVFGFQKDNVKNQREHLVLLISRAQTSSDPENGFLEVEKKTMDAVLNRMLKFYEGWCDRLDKKYCYGQPKRGLKIQLQIMYMSLYLLILGEADRVRFMPDCLCYIFHKMACQLSGLLSREWTACIDEFSDDAFMRKAIEPLIRVIEKEARKGENGEHWRDYDDLNEYFRSADCFSLGWPMQRNSDFFQSTEEAVRGRKSSGRRSRSTGKYAFWRILSSFDGSMTFHILALQAMVIAAWSGASSLKEIFQKESLYNISTIIITGVFLLFLKSIANLCRNFPGWKHRDLRMKVMGIVMNLAMFVGLTLCYLMWHPLVSMKLREMSSLLSEVEDAPIVYISSVGICCVWGIIAVFWSFSCAKIRLYADRTMNESRFMLRRYFPWKIYSMHEFPHTLIGYSLFWAIFLVSKLASRYFVQIKPLVLETKEMMKLNRVSHDWNVFSPIGNNLGAVVLLWQPAILAYYYWQVHFMDTQIWYTILVSLIDGVPNRIGESGLQEATAHASFVDDYMMFSRSHVKALELMMLLVFANISRLSLWSLVATTILGPFLLKPLGFELHKVERDWDEWRKWMNYPTDFFVPATKSWESWWNAEQEYRKSTGLESRFRAIVLSLRFFLYQYGIIHQLIPHEGSNTIMLYGLSWLFLVAVILVLKIKTTNEKILDTNLGLLLVFVVWLAVLVATASLYQTFMVNSMFLCLLSSVPAGWGLLQISLACRPVVERLGMWSFVKELARGFDRITGLALFGLVALLARLPGASRVQTGCYFCPNRI